MIRDARALEHQFVPQDLTHRDGQIDALASALSPITYGGIGENTLIDGPSGSGKTTLSKYVARKLDQERLDFSWGYVNCQSDPTPTAALHELIRTAGLGARRPEGTSRSYYFDRLRQYDGQIVTIIDEANVVTDPKLIHALVDIPGVTVICICVDDDDLIANSEVGPGTQSRLRSMMRMSLNSYSHQELLDILSYRVEHGLDGSRVDDEAIAAIADSAAGNARLAITHLRRAARYVMNEDSERLTRSVVEAVADDAQAAVRDLHVRSLGTHQRALYTIIRDAGSKGVTASDLHERYENRTQSPRSKSMRRRYLTSLQRYDLISQSGSGRGTRYKVVRHTEAKTVNP
ncbi:Cdc6/Cdc18 family protein [Salinibaculum salinum]|uniref:Cdc6/Cdc18 family protein n=1 Tax=Salinibaculum salinum TaxID=3131996 RepID=UPI0030EE8C86